MWWNDRDAADSVGMYFLGSMALASVFILIMYGLPPSVVRAIYAVVGISSVIGQLVFVIRKRIACRTNKTKPLP